MMVITDNIIFFTALLFLRKFASCQLYFLRVEMRRDPQILYGPQVRVGVDDAIIVVS